MKYKLRGAEFTPNKGHVVMLQYKFLESTWENPLPRDTYQFQFLLQLCSSSMLGLVA